MRSQKRREEFKAVWGVSPRSINRKRTVKTVINVHNVVCSPDVPKCESEENSDIDDNLSDTKDMFELKEVLVSNEDGVNDTDLERTIPNDLFELYIDANFSQPLPETNHNFSGITTIDLNTPKLEEIVPSIQVEDFLKELSTKNEDNDYEGNKTNSYNINEKEQLYDINLGADADLHDNLEEIDMEMEHEAIVPATEDSKNDLSSQDAAIKMAQMADIHNEHKNLEIVHNSKDVEEVKNTTNLVDKWSSDGKINDNGEAKKSQKSVRFLNATPNEDIRKDFQALTGSDKHSHTSETESNIPKRKPKRHSIQVQIPVHFKTG